MTPISLVAADNIYACSEKPSYMVHYAHHTRFRTFSIALTHMDRALGEIASDDFWRDWLRQLRRYRFDLSAAPLPFDHPAAIVESQLSSLQERVVECDAIFPDFAQPARALIEQLRDLVVAGDNPLLQVLKRLFPEGPEQEATAILVKESRLIPAAESVLELDPHLRGITVISAQQLRGGTGYSRIAVIGRAGWFPDYVFMAPRAQLIDIIQFDWIDPRWEPSTSFAASAKATTPTFTLGEPGGLAPEQGSATVDVIPPVDWDAIVATSKAQYRSEFKQEKTPARLVLLNGGLAVYLDADEQATVTVIDADQDGAAVKRVLVRRIEPGTFVLLRTEGGGDYIVPVADRIMGTQAVAARALQNLWKDLLADYVRRAGLQDTCRALERRGATHANETNVRNWQNKRKIRPEYDEDFTAILNLTELSASASDYRQAMKLIDNAHQRAGQCIRELLLAQVDGADLHELHRLGRMDFELPDAGSGSLTAFQVESISSGVFPVPLAILGHPFDSEGKSWHE